MIRQRKPLAAIDLGTNSFHLLVVDVDPTKGRFKIIDRKKELVRLGSGSSDMKYLTQQAMSRGIEALKRFKRIADASRAPVRAVATSAVREALNQDVFIKRVKAETGITVEIVSGVEEARLIYLGVLQALPVYDKQILLIDIGGGSTEFLVGRERKILYDNSLKIGAMRLSERFFESSKTTTPAVKKCKELILGMMNPILRAIKETEYEIAIGTSGTILNIAHMISCGRKEEPLARLNNFTFTRDELFDITDRIVKAKDARDRLKIPGIDPKRVDIIVAGALILEQVFKELKIREMTVSEFALREGIVFDTIEKKHRKTHGHALNDIRYGSVLHLAENFGYEREHSHHVAHLSLRIFDETKRLHRLGDTEREYLEAAAILHEIGLSISHSQHHLHSYYLVRNAEMLGFTENEKEIIANIARYHRKSHPKDKHSGFQNLSAEERALVAQLASMLRIADGLDRTHASVIADLKGKVRKKSLQIRLKKKKGSPTDLELWGANRKKELFENTFKREVKFSI